MSITVLHVFDHSLPLHSGYTFRSHSILREQQRRGWRTLLLTSSKQGKTDALVETVDDLVFHRTKPGLLSTIPVLNQVDVILGLYRRLDALIREQKPNFVHAHSPALNGVAALWAARKNQVPFVYEVRAFWEDAAVDHGTSRENGWRYRFTRALETYVLKRANHVTCICEGLRNDICERGVSPDNVTVIPNAVDAQRFELIQQRNRELEQSLQLQAKATIGFLGSFYAYEGLDLLIDAMALLKTDLPELRLLLVGGGPQEKILKARAEQKGVAQNIQFIGRVPHKDIERYYSVVDVLVYPRHSMRLTELVTPLKPLEAMAQGKIVLASDVGGHHELISDKQNGYLFRAGDAHQLAGAIKTVLESRQEWPFIIENGRRYVEDERNWQRSVSRYESVYQAAQRAFCSQ